ncbi:hypothetical protein AGABI2DRAFT_118180 [Agaricus bisporus var. bisporus H97]|uniref:hypothetical protein n=1 Tax=Agaricus bisporus var. bisporus (strain H97 / ATCC MYA-4626 / FGSC 10389) TaxID=936046 RepID=UPI00029F5363|nr:hypothetical protein AGABI2DRAFT_118180 [Agaricus bisporus var. bisporus H97]EKV47626.1 hypothetical protein AGABI2DRAFT_118180 [Agaricus bisporus var. bisporus H97]
MADLSVRWFPNAWTKVKHELNFFRIHVIYITVTPIVLAAILYAANGRYHITYVDALYNSYSAMTNCGLATVNLSSMTVFQQVLLLVQMNIGNIVFVSWFVVYFRRQYFRKQLQHILKAEVVRRSKSSSREDVERQRSRRMSSRLSSVPEESDGRRTERRGTSHRRKKKIRPEMIRRLDGTPQLVNPSGWISEKVAGKSTPIQGPADRVVVDSDEQEKELSSSKSELSESNDGQQRQMVDVGVSGMYYRTIWKNGAILMHASQLPLISWWKTIEFAPVQHPNQGEIQLEPAADMRSLRGSVTRNDLQVSPGADETPSRNRGFGGFPMPFAILNSIISKLFPRFQRHLSRAVTMPATTSFVSTQTAQPMPPHAKAVPYISFNAIVGRNSEFRNLTNEQLEELGGIEYRALNVLLWLIGLYFFGLQVLGFVIIVPYMYQQRWGSTFEAPPLTRHVTPGWFSVYQISSSFTNTGSSLVDQSLLPYQRAYLLLIIQWMLILLGNTGFPVLLRFIIWSMTKWIPRESRLNETLHFLLDHPRRCYIYLFQSHQTWFLFAIIVIFTGLQWFFFMLLDIGQRGVEDIPLNVRFSAGLFQAVAVRAAGFVIIQINTLAPAVQVLYLIMMYITVIPIALSVRSSNVYEEQALGVYKPEDDPEVIFETAGGSRMRIWGRYFAMHARRQLAFDLWWLAIALFLICIIERRNLNNPDNTGWFNIFTLIFETVSAYGPVGLSFGVPYDNFSLSGAFATLSKLIICITMIRGRHRNLPSALDRSILLPTEFKRTETHESDHASQASQGTSTSCIASRHSRDGTMHDNSGDPNTILHRRATRHASMPSILGPEPTDPMHRT